MSLLPSYDEAGNKKTHEKTAVTQAATQFESPDTPPDATILKLSKSDLEAANPLGDHGDSHKLSQDAAPERPKGLLFRTLTLIMYAIQIIFTLLFCTGILMASLGRLCESPQRTVMLFGPGAIMLIQALQQYGIKHGCFRLEMEDREALADIIMILACWGPSFAFIGLVFHCKCQ